MLFNRDLSWLGFNHLVLQQARKNTIPLYERLKFLAIFSSNLDEFFRVRYPVIVAFSRLGAKTVRKASLFPKQEGVPDAVQDIISEQLAEFGDILLNRLIPELKGKGIFFYYNSRIRPEHYSEIREIFISQVLSFIQPIVLNVHSSKDFFPENGLLYFVVTVRDKNSDSQRHVVINIPSHRLKRFYELSEIAGMKYVIFIDDIVRENIDLLLPNETVEGVYSIKFNRDSEFRWEGEYSPDMLEKLEKKLAKRDQGAPSRFLFENTMPRNLQFFLAAMFQINIEDMFEGGRYHNLNDLNDFPSFNKTLHFPAFKPIPHPPEAGGGDIFNITSGKEILLHIPYHAYTPVLSFFNQAAVDEKVTEIYISLYRVASESHIVNALISAARNGKKVVCFIELKARFDEVNNIRWSRIMKEAGVQLVYSDPRIKVHSKIALVKRTEEGESRHYSLISTGNFNEITARFYTDHVLFTKDEEIAKELLSLFAFMESKKVTLDKMKLSFNRLLVSQFNWIPFLGKAIRKQIRRAQAGEKAVIRIKVNNLEDPWIIGELYKASQYGVEVRLLVRSVCCLVPQKDGLSENIKIKRIVDRFLEHTRLFIFGEGDEAAVLMGSSDLMIRNLRRRIEVMISVKSPEFKKELTDYFELQWADDTNAVWLSEDLANIPVEGTGIHNGQRDIYSYLQQKQ